MSGGSYNYIYCKLSEECADQMYDDEMNDLIKDLVEVLHDLEFWQSGDTSEERYRETLSNFKTKWFGGNREERKNNILKALAEDRNDYARDCNARIEKENGKIIGADYMLQRFLDILKTTKVDPPERVGCWIDDDGKTAICSSCDRLNVAPGIYCKHCGSRNDKKGV